VELNSEGRSRLEVEVVSDHSRVVECPDCPQLNMDPREYPYSRTMLKNSQLKLRTKRKSQV
jgi:hypothetical protein